MLEQLSIWWYRTGGDNPSSAANQQERLIDEIRILRDYTPNTPALRWSEDIVRSAWRHAGWVFNPSLQMAEVTRVSEIPCRVSSDLHEWRNAGHTVSTRDSVKLKSL